MPADEARRVVVDIGFVRGALRHWHLTQQPSRCGEIRLAVSGGRPDRPLARRSTKIRRHYVVREAVQVITKHAVVQPWATVQQQQRVTDAPLDHV